MIVIFIFFIIVLLISIYLFFISPKRPITPGDTESIIKSEKCMPKLSEVDEYAATYALDKDGDCMPATCKYGYNLYYSDPKSINKFKRCQ